MTDKKDEYGRYVDFAYDLFVTTKKGEVYSDMIESGDVSNFFNNLESKKFLMFPNPKGFDRTKVIINIDQIEQIDLMEIR